MKMNTLCLMFVSFVASEQALALCTLDKTPPLGGGDPATLTISARTITIDADAVASRSQDIASFESTRGNKVSFLCNTGEAYGKSVQAPIGEATQDRMFATNIDGIEIQPLWNNGASEGMFPSQSAVRTGRFDYPPVSHFKIKFYKTKEHLNLTDPAGDVILPAGNIAYNWINSNSPTEVGQTLSIGEIRLISTPVCRIDGAKTVDFNTVSATNISNGVKRALDFSLTCITDYGDYTVSAALSTQNPTDDNRFIKVTDSSGNTDRMKIRIDDSTGTQLSVDGSQKELKRSISNNTAAQFNWTATLLRTAQTQALPANGRFSATAEIILQGN